jgi:glycyl-tRNA synthetase
MGIVLKNNIHALWMREFVQKRKDMVALDASILMNPQVWVASGHVGSFSDPLMECKACHTRHRADKLIEDMLEKNSTYPVPTGWAGDKTSLENMNIYMKE